MAAIWIITAIAGLVWSAVLFRRTGLLGGCLAVLLAGSCFSWAFYETNIGPIPITIDRLLVGVLVAAFSVSWRLGHLASRPLDKQDLVLIGLLAVLALSILSHGGGPDTIKAIMTLFLFFAIPFVLYWVARNVTLSQKAHSSTLAAIAAFGLYLAVTAIFEKYGVRALIFPRFIGSPDIAEFFGRARGPFLNPSGNGLFLCTGLFSLLMFVPHTNRLGKLGIGLLGIVYLAGIYCTLTRCVWASAILGLLTICVLNVRRRWAVTMVMGTVVAGSVVIGAKWNDLNAFKRDRDVSVADMSKSAELRPVLAAVAWHMFLDRPLWGCGYGRYPTTSTDYLSDRSTELRLERVRGYIQHNVVLSLLTETGLIGTCLFCALFVLWGQTAWSLWRNLNAPLIFRQQGLVMLVTMMAYLGIGMFQDLTLVPMANTLLLFVAGITRSVSADTPGRARTASLSSLSPVPHFSGAAGTA